MKTSKPKLTVKPKQKLSSLSHETMVLVSAVAIIMTIGFFSAPWLDRVVPPLPAQASRPAAQPPAPVACTLEAKLCPDGSYVGRVAPSCQFAPCPQAAELTTWRQYTDDEAGFSLALPETWEGYKVGKSKYSNHDTTCFYFDGDDRRSFCIMQLLTFTPAQWSELSAKGRDALASRVLTSAGIVVALDYSEGCVQLDEFQCARSQEVPEIFRAIQVQ